MKEVLKHNFTLNVLSLLFRRKWTGVVLNCSKYLNNMLNTCNHFLFLLRFVLLILLFSMLCFVYSYQDITFLFKHFFSTVYSEMKLSPHLNDLTFHLKIIIVIITWLPLLCLWYLLSVPPIWGLSLKCLSNCNLIPKVGLLCLFLSIKLPKKNDIS